MLSLKILFILLIFILFYFFILVKCAFAKYRENIEKRRIFPLIRFQFMYSDKREEFCYEFTKKKFIEICR